MPPSTHKSSSEWNDLVKEALNELEPPQAVLQYAINAFSAYKPLKGGMSSAESVSHAVSATVRFITATLSFDSAASPRPALGVRSVGTATQHLLFSAEGCEIDLRLSPAGTAFMNIAGQVLGAGFGGTVELRNEQNQITANLNQLNEFTLPHTPCGAYSMTVRLPDREVLISSLRISAVGT